MEENDDLLLLCPPLYAIMYLPNGAMIACISCLNCRHLSVKWLASSR